MCAPVGPTSWSSRRARASMPAEDGITLDIDRTDHPGPAGALREDDGRRVLVLDVGTSGVRAVVVGAGGAVLHNEHRECLPITPGPGRVEFDPVRQAELSLALGRDAIAATGPADAVAVTNQRGSTVCWERSSGRPVGNGIGWQDQRAMEQAILLAGNGIIASPGSMGPAAAWHVANSGSDAAGLCVGTIDTWIAWNLTGGDRFVTDASNVSAGMLWSRSREDVDPVALEVLGLPRSLFADVVDTAGAIAEAGALPGGPPLMSLVGDQMASLVGQGAMSPGAAKATFGTGGMVDLAVGNDPGTPHPLTTSGCVPMVARRSGGRTEWMIEGTMFAAGVNVGWLRDGLGVLDDAASVDAVAAGAESSNGVRCVPALLGLGTPNWNYSVRGAFFGISPATTRAEIVRAVLEGVAHLAADILDALERDTGYTVPVLRVDGGMSRSTTFTQALADAVARPVAVAAEPEMTALGAAYLAGEAAGIWSDRSELDSAWKPGRHVEPAGELDRDAWHAALELAIAAAATERA